MLLPGPGLLCYAVLCGRCFAALTIHRNSARVMRPDPSSSTLLKRVYHEVSEWWPKLWFILIERSCTSSSVAHAIPYTASATPTSILRLDQFRTSAAF